MLYIDASRYSNTTKRTGVENYSYFLINELVRRNPDNITLLTPRKIDLKVKQRIIPLPRLWTLIRLSWEIWRDKTIDNLFVPSHVLPLIHPKNSTITIHDVVFKYSPESYSLLSRVYLNWATTFAVKHVAKIITPSEATKNDLIHFYKADEKKIHVVPLGFEPMASEVTEKEEIEILDHFSLKKETYFLAIGRIEYKKNTDTLLKAFYEFAEKNPDIKLVLCGFPGHGGQAILDSIVDKWKSRVVLTGYVTEKQKAVLLKNTLCFIFPSRFEGFGLPLLEAMSAKVPIIASNILSSKEVAGGGILFFDKENAKELSSLMQRMIESSELRGKMTEKYGERLKNYSWERCAEEVEKIISCK